MNTSHRRVPVIALCFSAFLLPACFPALTHPRVQAAAQSKDIEKKLQNRTLHWDPPQVDAPFHSRTSSAPCVLSSVLQQAGARAKELAANLQNFTAQERIEYEFLDNVWNHLEGGLGTFDYVVVLKQLREGVTVQESRAPEHGSFAFPASTQDVGLPGMALIFLPEFQGDYEMNCEGATEWNAQPAWVVHFQQRADKPGHTASFGARSGAYPARLKGRAWIAQGPNIDSNKDAGNGSGEVVHLETSLLEPIPAIKVRNWYLSIDYAPVQFRTQNVKVWLPQAVDAYCEFGNHRTIIYHTFTNFLLFSVQTDQVIAKPKTP